MIMILSPAKIFREYSVDQLLAYNPVSYQQQTEQLVERLSKLKVNELEQLMKVSEDIAKCNEARYKRFNEPGQKGYYAVDYFYGEAFKGLDAPTLSEEARAFMQEHLRVLSGLYGSLKPMDVIQPYRLEMGSKLSNKKGDSLYKIWKPLLTKEFLGAIAESKGEKVLLNLASDEYSKAIDLKHINKSYPVLTLSFKVKKGETYKVVGMHAKRARGLMVRYICEHQIEKLEALKEFNLEGYHYCEILSTDSEWTFVKE